MDIKHHHFAALGSTQTQAKTFLDAGEPTPFLVTAETQTAGRGRMERAWVSPPGNFYGSLVWPAAVPMDRYGEYSFLAGVALIETLRALSDQDFTLKWPNDVLLSGRKCAGILIESHGAANEFLIIGMGVNLRHAPPDDAVQTPAAAIWPEGAAPDLNANFIELLLKNFSNWHELYETQGFETVRSAWLQHSYRQGEEITVKTPTETYTGIFTGIDNHGNLLLTLDGQTRKITTADVALS